MTTSAQVDDRMAAYLAGMVVREVGLGVLRGNSGEQEGPPLLANAVMVVGPVSRGCLHHNVTHVLICFTVQTVTWIN
jgi:hypothetical protein